MDWHAAVYGSRTGESGEYGFHDDPDDMDDLVVYGRQALVSDTRLRQYGGKAYYRAYEVVSGHRFDQLSVEEHGNELTLRALVHNVYELSDDYMVRVKVDQDAGDIVDSSCTCPAFGRNGAVCKHVIAILMLYNESPDKFVEDGYHGQIPPLRRIAPARRTSSSLQAFMRKQDDEHRRSHRDRELELLKEVSSHADAEHEDQAMLLSRYLPIASVSLRPGIALEGGRWVLRLRITVPSRGISYVVKDLALLVEAVQKRLYVTYGKRLAFVHSIDTFDERSCNVLNTVGRGIEIRRSGTWDSPRSAAFGRSTVSAAAQMVLSQDEISQILDLFVDSDATIDYAPSGSYYTQAIPTRVVDGNPDLAFQWYPTIRTAAEGRILLKLRAGVLAAPKIWATSSGTL